MKKIIALSMVCALVVAFSTPVGAAPVDKLKNGLTDIIKSPLEIVDHTKAEAKEAKFLPFGVMGGLLKGTFYMGKKVVGGVIDVVTFPIE